jgi:hypothetical protein
LIALGCAWKSGTSVRDIGREEALGGGESDDSIDPNWVLEKMEASSPDPAVAAVLTEEFARRLNCLSEPLRKIALWKLEGYSN